MGKLVETEHNQGAFEEVLESHTFLEYIPQLLWGLRKCLKQQTQADMNSIEVLK